ncbi:hypothetical protein Bbelb_242490 [Branchiostoma belcheri]|nr:hypothetical protein Bbelb_242490 [Branchiostoma belcheri]
MELAVTEYRLDFPHRPTTPHSSPRQEDMAAPLLQSHVADANAFDIAPRYAIVLAGICRVLCRVAGLAFPLVVTALTKNKSTKESSYVIIITAGVFADTALFFGAFGSGKEQLWAQLDHNGVIQDRGNQRGDIDLLPPYFSRVVGESLKVKNNSRKDLE